MKERCVSFREAVNSAVRAGCGRMNRRRKRFVQRTYSLGAEERFRWDKALAVAEAIEDEELTESVGTKEAAGSRWATLSRGGDQAASLTAEPTNRRISR